MKSLIIRQRASNSATLTGFSPMTRRAESPRPMPMTARPPEMSCSVAYIDATTVGSRVPGLVTNWPSFMRSVRSAASVSSAVESCQSTWESYVQPYWNPCASASSMSSRKRVYGGSGRTVTPKLSIEPPRRCGRGRAYPRRSGSSAMWGYVAFGLVAGAMIPFQAGINAQLATWVGSPIRAALVSFVIGTLALLALTLAFFRAWPGSEKIGGAPWWVWLGGLLGAFYVAGSTIVAPKLGAVTLLAVILAGQAAASVLIDQYGWVPAPTRCRDFGIARRPPAAARQAELAEAASSACCCRRAGRGRRRAKARRSSPSNCRRSAASRSR